MELFRRWFAPRAALAPRQAERLAAWRALPAADTSAAFAQARYVVVDVETTGLNLASDRLISIGAVAVVDGRIVLGESFYVVLRQQESSSRENILIHGITGTDQREGLEPAEALLSFLEFLGKSPLIAFHVTFDKTMIRRALRQHLGLRFEHPWLDLAYVMPALYPPLAYDHRLLDEWLRHFNIRVGVRHHALADALATAQLLQVAFARARRKDLARFSDLRDQERMQRWIEGVS